MNGRGRHSPQPNPNGLHHLRNPCAENVRKSEASLSSHVRGYMLSLLLCVVLLCVDVTKMRSAISDFNKVGGGVKLVECSIFIPKG